MRIEHRFPLDVSRQTAWSLLSDPDRVAGCLPGCRVLRQGPDGVREAEVGVELGPARLTFHCEVRIAASRPPERLSITAVGRPRGLGGQLRLELDLGLAAVGEWAAEVSLDAELRLGGALGAMGEPAFRAKAAETLRQFADNVRAALEVPGDAG